LLPSHLRDVIPQDSHRLADAVVVALQQPLQIILVLAQCVEVVLEVDRGPFLTSPLAHKGEIHP
jgi:hypothetical protein